MKKKWLLGMSVVLLGGLLAACSTASKEEKKSDKIKVSTTFYPMYEFTKEVVGDAGEVEMIVPSGVEAHDFEPSAKDLKKIQDSDVFVYNNENMETWVPSIKSVLKEGDVATIKATENMVLMPGNEEEDEHHHEHNHETEESHNHGEEGHSHELDPHVWLAPSLAMKEVEEIRDQLIKKYPQKEKTFKINADNYLKKLSTLDQSYKETLANAKQKSFVTQHAAFGYLALEYGLTQVPISGLSPDEEPSPARLVELNKFVKDNDIKYIYFESNATNAIAKTLAKETGVELLVLNPLEGLSKEEIKNGDNYLSVMEKNLKALSKTTGTNTSKTSQAKEPEKTVQTGYFEDSQIEDRPLSNWKGEWQSVYPLLKDGTLDQVFEYKAKAKKDKSAEEYKKYYETGYKTNIKEIDITDSSMTFIDDDGKKMSSDYKYVGREILTYEKGNRGVRYCFEAVDPSQGAFKYVQFSDHEITDTKSGHFHLYFGNDSQESLYKELENWPTYYPKELSGKEVAQEMIAH
ncbi:metal ABC transporter solute-binding protein, Zn/Mn family [Vagococcus sp. JNUCC 83]